MVRKNPIFLDLIRGELKALLALTLLLLAVVGFVLAAEGNVVAKLDFGTAAFSDKAAGYILIPGGAGNYPKKEGDLLFSWSNPSVLIEVSRPQVASKTLRDYNGSSAPATFKIAGLAEGQSYRLVIHSGDGLGPIGTRLMVGEKILNLESAPGQFETAEVIASAPNGFIDIALAPLGSNIWALNALEIYKTQEEPAPATFEFFIEPAGHVLPGGGRAIYQIKVDSPSGYAYPVVFSISGLTSGFSASFVPPRALFFPFTGELRITASKNVVSLPYQFVVTARGEGPDKLVRQQVIILEIRAGTSEETVGETPLVTLPPVQYTPPSRADFFKSAELLAFVERKRDEVIAKEKEIEDLGNLRLDLASFPINPNLPETPGVLGQVLDGLTKGGIINLVVDTAPPAKIELGPPRPRGLMEMLLGLFITKPVS